MVFVLTLAISTIVDDSRFLLRNFPISIGFGTPTSPSGRDAILPLNSTSPRSKSCPLNSPGHFNPDGNFVLDDPSCPWVDYVGNILTKADDALTPDELQQKERLVHSQNMRNILVIGDSQERNMLQSACAVLPGATFKFIPPRWTLPDGTIHTAPRKTMQFRVCRIGEMRIANFFIFGFSRSVYRWPNHSAEGEPVDVLDRVNDILPKYIEDAFGKDYAIDLVVINTGLWDLLASYKAKDPSAKLETLKQTNSLWHTRANSVADSLEALLPTTPIWWRNMPPVVRFFRFQIQEVDFMNDVGVAFAASRNWPVLDLREPLQPLGASAVKKDGFHMNEKGWKLYLNRMLNALVEHQLA